MLNLFPSAYLEIGSLCISYYNSLIHEFSPDMFEGEKVFLYTRQSLPLNHLSLLSPGQIKKQDLMKMDVNKIVLKNYYFLPVVTVFSGYIVLTLFLANVQSFLVIILFLVYFGVYDSWPQWFKAVVCPLDQIILDCISLHNPVLLFFVLVILA